MNMNNHSSCHPVHVRLSIFEILDTVKRQVEHHAFARQVGKTNRETIDPIYNELCLIMAEVFAMPPDTVLRVAGIETSAQVVQEVFRELRHDHLELVYTNFKGITHKIHSTKSYLRTALYNSIFEIDSHYTNRVNNDLHGS
jgi:hypothetical protein